MLMSYLQDDSILLVGIDELEVFDGRHRHSAIEVQNIGADLFVPTRRLVDQIHQIAEISVLDSSDNVILLR